MGVDRYRSDPYDFPDPFGSPSSWAGLPSGIDSTPATTATHAPLMEGNSNPVAYCPHCGRAISGDRWFVQDKPAFTQNEQTKEVNKDVWGWLHQFEKLAARQRLSELECDCFICEEIRRSATNIGGA